MCARQILLRFLGASFGLMMAKSALATTGIFAWDGPAPEGYNTLRIDQFVEQSDITNYNVTAWIHNSNYYKDEAPTPVENSRIERRPATAGLEQWYLRFNGAPPIPPQSVGMWRVFTTLALEYYRCVVFQGVPQCGYAYFCQLYGAGEPCESDHSVYIQ